MCSQLGRHSLVRYTGPVRIDSQYLTVVVTFFSFWLMAVLRFCSGARLPALSGNRWYMQASQKWQACRLQPVVNTTGSRNLLLAGGRNCLATTPVRNCASLREVNPDLHNLGWLTAIGWQVYLASVCFLVGTIIQGLIVLNNPSYVFERWHGTCLAIAIVFFCIIFNTTLASRLPVIGMSNVF